MDANSLTNYNNHQKHDDEGKGESGMKLCDLPDAILQEIISNFPTKYAVQTSVLSKRWVDTWKGISKIELEEIGAPDKRQLFIDFVEKLLVVCKSSLIKNFSLIFEVGEEASRVSEWLRVFAKPNIEELKLELENVQQPLIFPDNLFSSQTLTKFQLSMKQVFNLPSSINFENLVSLTLKHVIFPAGASTQELFRGSQFLKELTLIDCKWTNVIRFVSILCPLLEKVSIREWRDNDDDNSHEHEGGGVIPAVVDYLSYCHIMISGNNLKTFSYDGNLINDYFLSCKHSIINATIEVHQPEDNNRSGIQFVYNFITTLSNVKKLTLSNYAIEVISGISNLIEFLPLFHQLVELCVGSTSPTNLSSVALQAILHRSPLLKKVNFVMGVSLGENGTNDVDPLPVCFTMHLKMITICNFCGNEEELTAIKSLLQTTPLLDTLDIYSNPNEFESSEGTKTLDKLFKQIVQFPTASQNIRINLRMKNL